MDAHEISKLNDWHKSNEIEVCSAFSTVRTKVIKIKNKRRTPYEFVYDGKTLKEDTWYQLKNKKFVEVK